MRANASTHIWQCRCSARWAKLEYFSVLTTVCTLVRGAVAIVATIWALMRCGLPTMSATAPHSSKYLHGQSAGACKAGVA